MPYPRCLRCSRYPGEKHSPLLRRCLGKFCVLCVLFLCVVNVLCVEVWDSHFLSRQYKQIYSSSSNIFLNLYSLSCKAVLLCYPWRKRQCSVPFKRSFLSTHARGWIAVFSGQRAWLEKRWLSCWLFGSVFMRHSYRMPGLWTRLTLLGTSPNTDVNNDKPLRVMLKRQYTDV